MILLYSITPVIISTGQLTLAESHYGAGQIMMAHWINETVNSIDALYQYPITIMQIGNSL